MSHSPSDHPNSMFQKLAYRYRSFFSQKGAALSCALASLALFIAWWVNYYAIIFATKKASNPVADIILSNIPVFEVDGFFVYGTFVYAIASFAIAFANPKRIPFVFYAVALFWIIRSAFTALTHLAPFEVEYISDFGPTITEIFFGADRFFSAHTGMPFLGALMLWREKYFRAFYLFGAAYFGVVVLLGHLHYSIDVASAFFITYAIYHLAIWAFPRSYELFHSVESELR